MSVVTKLAQGPGNCLFWPKVLGTVYYGPRSWGLSTLAKGPGGCLLWPKIQILKWINALDFKQCVAFGLQDQVCRRR